jgi:hypothetical protein
MRRILIAATILAAACGGKKTIPATAEIKASAAEAQQGMSSSTANTQATIGLQSVASDVADAAVSGDVSFVDLSGLPTPDAAAIVVARAPESTVRQSLRATSGSTAATTAPAGCLRRNGSNAPALVPSGTAGCTASDHLEVTYDNGDKVNITWTGTDTSFDLRVVVVAGPWTGTNLHYTGQAGLSSATVQVSGAMKYSSGPGAAHIDADFNVTYTASLSESSGGSGVAIHVGGTATDHIALVRAVHDWTLTMTTTTSGQTQQLTMDWNGRVEIDLLKADAATTDHAVAFNLHLHATGSSTATSGDLTYSVGGDIEWDGAVVGNVVAKNNQLYVEWTDNTEDTFDPSTLLLAAL